MALPIIENPIYGQMTLETSAWASTFTWVDRTADIVNGINYSEGGRLAAPGQSQVDTGTLNVTFKNLATPPLVGDLVRLRRTGTTQYAFTGYVQDVSQRVVFDQSVSFNTPVTLTSIICLDWVGYVSQFQFEGLGGVDESSGNTITSSLYIWEERMAAINKAIDNTYATKMISFTLGVSEQGFGDTDLVGTMSEHLDLIASTAPVYWYGKHTIPTNKTTGRTGLVHLAEFASAPSSGKTFTDLAGTAGQLHYTEIDFQSSSANVANTIVANNRARINIGLEEVTQIGGFNQENYLVINGVDTVGVGFDATWKESDATSITTYGNRQAEITTNSGFQATSLNVNLLANPSFEYSDTGWGASNLRIARRKPSENVTPFAAVNGEWALRCRSSAVGSPSFAFTGSESDAMPVVAGRAYQAQGWAMRGVPNRTDVRGRMFIQFFDEAGSSLSQTFGAQTSLPGGLVWTQVSVTATAPAGAERAYAGIQFNRSGGGNFTLGDIMWGDAFMFRRSASATPVTYYDGDTLWDNSYMYFWTGGVGLSPSFRISNDLDTLTQGVLARYSTTGIEVTRIRWNAQEDLASVSALYVGSTISIVYDGTTTSHRIIGIDGNIDTDRYMIDYYLEKV
jgi:hypothetical protein